MKRGREGRRGGRERRKRKRRKKQEEIVTLETDYFHVCVSSCCMSKYGIKHINNIYL